MRRYLYRAALSCSRLFSLFVILSTAPSVFCANQTNTASFTQGIANYNAKNYSGAKKSLLAYLQANPNDYKAHFYLANSLVKLGNLDDASNEYKKVLTLTPDSKVGGYSMEAFNKISDMHSQSQTPVAPTQVSASSQFGYGSAQPTSYQNMRPNFYNNAGTSNDLIPASVAGSGAKLSPTVDSRDQNSLSNNGQFGRHHGHNFHNQGFNPYMNGGPPGPMFSMNNPGQYGNSQFGNPFPMGRHRRRFQSGYPGGANNNYSANAGRFHTGGYIKNYEITDTPSGDALPLVADQQKLEDLVRPSPTKKVLNRN